MEKLISALIILIFTVSAQAATIYLDANGTGDYPTIQAAIDDANDGDIIILQPGTYTGDGNRDIDFLGKAITVRSIDPNDPNIVADTIIDCNGSETNRHRGFKFHSHEDTNSVINGFTIINGYALYEPFGHSLIKIGGAIYCDNSSPTINNCTISGNSVDYGDGGGIACYHNSNPVIKQCTIKNNVSYNGGGLDCHKSSPIVSNCIFTSNIANGDSGAISIFVYSNPIITNCTFSRNSATHRGGGICRGNYSDPTIINCTIADNLAADEGGGIYAYTYNGSSTGTVSNGIIWYNSPDQIYTDDMNSLKVRFSDIEGGWPGIGNIDTEPCFANADANDYHLKSQAGRWKSASSQWITDTVTSPCIDAGNPGCPPGDEPDPNGNRINMGAYGGTAYASKSPAGFRSLSDMDNNWVVGLNDLAIFVDYWLDNGTCVASDLDRSSAVDFEDYAVFTYDPCSQASAYEPNIVYTIEDCDMGFITLYSDSNNLRFNVTVEGRYILFEDMMLANCCPDELELQMTVEGNLITINEVEYLSIACDCLCYYPVTATLGPFSSGTYTLGVYQDEYYGGFIGSTTVTIP